MIFNRLATINVKTSIKMTSKVCYLFDSTVKVKILSSLVFKKVISL